MSGHKRQLETDPKYGKDGFFAGWPEEVRKSNWKEWLQMLRDEQLHLLGMMPETDTTPWNNYQPQQSQAI